MPKEDDPITKAFIGQAMKVHSLISPGLDEEIYHQELVTGLRAAGIQHLSKPRRDLTYRGIVADTFEADFLVEDHFIPELKCLRGEFAAEHFIQVFSYSKMWRRRICMLVNFGQQSLRWKRLAYESRSASLPDIPVPDFVTSPSLAASIVRSVSDCLTEIGLGYRETTWKGLVKAALLSNGLKVTSNPSAEVLRHSGVTMPSLVVEGECAVLVTALSDGISATDRAILQTHLRWLNLGWGVVFHFGKSTADLHFVNHPKKPHLPIILHQIIDPLHSQSVGLHESVGEN